MSSSRSRFSDVCIGHILVSLHRTSYGLFLFYITKICWKLTFIRRCLQLLQPSLDFLCALRCRGLVSLSSTPPRSFAFSLTQTICCPFSMIGYDTKWGSCVSSRMHVLCRSLASGGALANLLRSSSSRLTKLGQLQQSLHLPVLQGKLLSFLFSSD